MIVMKFGGTSLGDAERIKQAASIIKSKLDKKPVVVLSAVGGITDMLIEAANNAAKGKVDLAQIREKHQTIVEELGVDPSTILELGEFEALLQHISKYGLTLKEMDAAQSFGEKLSTKIMADYLTRQGVSAKAFNAYDIGMRTDETFGNAELLEESYIMLNLQKSIINFIRLINILLFFKLF